MKIAINVSLVEELPNSPHLHPNDLSSTIAQAKALDYEGIEIFPRKASDIPVSDLQNLSSKHNLPVCVIGSGAGKAIYNLTLSDKNPYIRNEAVQYLKELVCISLKFNAMLVVGSMQGSESDDNEREYAIERLKESLYILAHELQKEQLTLLLEPINRYESTLINTLDEGSKLIQDIGVNNIKLLADIFHMNIEETSLSNTLRNNIEHIGHIHYVDSNRLAPGMGHIVYDEIFNVLYEKKYSGFMSIECFDKPGVLRTMEQASLHFKTNINLLKK
jgi:sugar phosphate isomerase/epimerase